MEYYQELFNHMSKYHDLILVQTEMDDIIDIVKSMLNNSSATKARAVTKNEQTKKECEHPYNAIIGEEHGYPKCLSCGELL